MAYDQYSNQPMQAVEMTLKMSFGKNSNLINSLDRFHNQHLFRKYSHIPFKNYENECYKHY